MPPRGLIEGPFAFERNGNYYLCFPHVAKKTERLEYEMAKSPTGPFTWTGVLMDESASGCWTNQPSIVQYQGQWYLFYHDKDLSPHFDKNRSVRADYLRFNDDGTIQKVIPTLRGVGICNARAMVQIDRYSAVSKTGTAVAFVDAANPAMGWKLTLSEKGAWVRYNQVDFGDGGITSVEVQSRSPGGDVVEIRLDTPDSPPLARVYIAKNQQWAPANAQLMRSANGLHDLIVTNLQNATVDLDWVRFR